MIVVAVATAIALPALGQTPGSQDKDDQSRGVRIIDAPSSAPVGPPRPAAPSVTETAPTAPETLPGGASTALPGVSAVPASPPTASSNVATLPPRPDGIENPAISTSLDMLSKDVKVANPAELALEILPGSEIALDSKVSFRITTKKPGYLILVDIDPTGKLTQIYPNPMSLMAHTDRKNGNFIRPGKPVQLPNPQDILSGFEFVASPPFGTAMVVGFLSDRPVQMIDLPDMPSTLLGSASAAGLLSKLANDLRIPDPAGNGAFQEAHWSMDVKFYAIK